MIKAVIFDLDGTIVKFNIDFRTVRAEVRGFLIDQGVPASILFVNESIFEMLKKAEIFMKNSGKSAAAVEALRKKALAIAEKYELEAAKTTSIQPGVIEVLKALREMGLKIGICTVNSQKSADYVLERFGIKEFFSAVVSREHVKYVKPNVEHLRKTLEALGVDPQEALVVGDSQADMRCAKDLGVMAVGIPTGVSTPRELMDAGADFLVTSITDIPVLIEQVNFSKPR
ncbi:MAG: HAD family hydrolase [Candidatus Bathyarchaeia archaeon]|nr:HAD family hydrolase [Candidatus Bathyarchaeota archaeon]